PFSSSLYFPLSLIVAFPFFSFLLSFPLFSSSLSSLPFSLLPTSNIQLISRMGKKKGGERERESTASLSLTQPGVQLHFVEMGSGPVVLLCHGFPETLAEAGYRVIVPDMKGYGDSSAPYEIEEYSQKVICKVRMARFFFQSYFTNADLFIGHYWGGTMVWNMALFYPERVRAVASLNSPFRPADPAVPFIQKIKSYPVFHYQLYFQEPGVAEAELEKDLTQTFKLTFRASDEKKVYMYMLHSGIVEGILKKSENPPRSWMVTEEEIEFYVQQFKKSGFRGPLNWYRNLDANWRWGCTGVRRKILIPALIVIAEKDMLLLPEFSKNMEKWVRMGFKFKVEWDGKCFVTEKEPFKREKMPPDGVTEAK
uniref:AB hydrolase-1 domain-containing protein n=1 Tax=Sarcophilus harrisii TaxID=9305 RepID=A0A7N4P685_SARHA